RVGIEDLEAVPGGGVGVEGVANFGVLLFAGSVGAGDGALIYDDRFVVGADVRGFIADTGVGVRSGLVFNGDEPDGGGAQGVFVHSGADDFQVVDRVGGGSGGVGRGGRGGGVGGAGGRKGG